MGFDWADEELEGALTPKAIPESPQPIIKGSSPAKDIFCPVCFHQIEHPVIMGEGTDSYQRRLRTYFGYCDACRAAHIVVQFAREERWIIHKYRPAVVLGAANIIEISDNWRTMSELPQPAPIMLGPGGDFKKPITPGTEGFVEKLRPMRKALGRLCEAIDEWLSDSK